MAQSLVAASEPRASLGLSTIRRGLNGAGRALDAAFGPGPSEIARHRDIAYTTSPTDRAHLLDVYVPATTEGSLPTVPLPTVPLPTVPLPTVVYLHGGGFRLFSKDTHWMMACAFARAGYVVVNANYRLAPEHPYPAALEDAADVLRWSHQHIAKFGGDPTKLVVAGESAGANLALALGLGETFAETAGRLGPLPELAACVAFSGFLDVSRERPEGHESALVRRRIGVMSRAYLGSLASAPSAHALLASPVKLLESSAPFTAAPPPVYASVGDRDPVLADTDRLEAALVSRGADVHVHRAAGEGHAFQALLFRRRARASWHDLHGWLASRLGAQSGGRSARRTSTAGIAAPDPAAGTNQGT